MDEGKEETFAEEIILEGAWRRTEEWWPQKAQLLTNASIVLATDGILLGLIVSSTVIGQGAFRNPSIIFLTVSSIMAIIPIWGRNYQVFDIRKAYDSSRAYHDNKVEFMRQLIADLDERDKLNNYKLGQLWIVHRASVLLLMAGLLTLALSVLL